ncbi:4Fe-4S binding protein [Marinilabiliaceae bacterium JC017]|nr:4Fe-4S binding protein [Marinilabiliaceae bacterium JC017]
MKQIKKVTPFTRYRDWIRAVFTLMFHGLVLIPHIFGHAGYDLETEYVVLGSIILLGPWFCGWACPFGNASYFISRIGTRFLPRWQFQLPMNVHKLLSFLKYPLMVYFVSLMIIRNVDYFGDHMVMYKTNIFTSGYIKFKHIAVLLIPFFLPRFFCKYLCFQKGAYNLINRLLPFSVIERDTNKCISCKKCDKVCPMQLSPSQKKHIAGNDCLSCFNCLDRDVCPTKHKALHLKIMGIKVNSLSFSIIATCIYVLATVLYFIFN